MREWLEHLGARVPTVVIARHGGGNNFDTVVDDDYLGARLMVDHLVALGHRSIAHTSEVSHGLDGHERALPDGALPWLRAGDATSTASSRR